MKIVMQHLCPWHICLRTEINEFLYVLVEIKQIMTRDGVMKGWGWWWQERKLSRGWGRELKGALLTTLWSIQIPPDTLLLVLHPKTIQPNTLVYPNTPPVLHPNTSEHFGLSRYTPQYTIILKNFGLFKYHSNTFGIPCSPCKISNKPFKIGDLE